MIDCPPFQYQPRVRTINEETQHQIYLMLRQGVSGATIAEQLDISPSTIYRLRNILGIVNYGCKPWTTQEDEKLRDYVEQNLHINVIAKRLERSRSGIQHRINHLHLARIHHNRVVYTAAQVGRILQVPMTNVIRWIDRGLIKAKKIRLQGKRSYRRVDNLDLYDFLAHPRHWHLYRVEQITDEFLRRDLVAVHRETPRWLQVADLMKRYHVQYGTVSSWCVKGQIPYEQVMRTLVFDPEKLKNWVMPSNNRKPHKHSVKTLRKIMTAYPELLTAHQMAERYGVIPGTITKWGREGIIPISVKVGRHLLFDPEQLGNWTPPNRVMNSQPVRQALAANPGLLTTQQVAERLGIHVDTVALWTRRGWLTHIRVGRIRMFDPEQFVDWTPPYVRRRKVTPTEVAAPGNGQGDDGNDERAGLDRSAPIGTQPIASHRAAA